MSLHILILICNLGVRKDQQDTGGVVVVDGDIYILFIFVARLKSPSPCGRSDLQVSDE